MSKSELSESSSGQDWSGFLRFGREKLLRRLGAIPLKRVAVEGYKGMTNYTPFHLRPVVLLTGQNSSGKSSLLEVLQVLGLNENLDGLSLHDLSAKLGSFSRVVSRSREEKRFSVSFEKFNEMTKQDVTITCCFEVDQENAQRCRLAMLTIETEEDIVIQLDISDSERVKGYINYPLLWKRFRTAFEDCVAVRNSDGAKFSEADGSSVSWKYLNYESFFKDVVQHFTTEDFHNFPVYYLERPLYGQDELYTIRFPFVDNDIDVNSFIQLERFVYENFFIDTYYEDASSIMSVLNELVFNPFKFLVSNESEEIPESLEDNPYWRMLRSGNCKTGFKTVELTYHRTYLAHRGLSEADLDILFTGDGFSARRKINDDKALAEALISEAGRKLLRRVKKEAAVRKSFNNFILAAVNDALYNAIPPHVFVPAVRNSSQLVMMNFGEAFHYNSFLQKAAAQFVSLSDSKKDFLSVHLNTLVSIFGFGSGLRLFSDETGLLHINIKKDDGEYGIIEEGYGISQLFSILLGVCVQVLRNVDESLIAEVMMGICDPDFGKLLVCIEEPESNLHPNYQSLLADAFVYLSREFGIQFILETHSEYMIRRLRYLTALWYKDPNALEGVPKEFWTAFYFNRPEMVSTEQPRVFEINVADEDGNLNRSFGHGFLDIATQSELDYLELFKPTGN